MSYIFDALKKSERERNQQEIVTGGNNSHAENVPDRSDTGKFNYLVVLMMIALVVVAFVLWQGQASKTEIVVKVKPEAKPVESTRIDKPVIDLDVNREKEKTAQTETRIKPRGYQELPFFWEMPALAQQGPGKLEVTIHVYSPSPSQRILFINNHEYKAGEKTREGVRVEEITSQGVVLSVNGKRFKLPRPR